MLKLRIKINRIFLITVLMTTMCTSTQAQDATASTTTSTTTPSASENYLKEILRNVNKLPIYLSELTKMAISWLTPDDSRMTATLQNKFTTLTNARLQNTKIQIDSQNRFLKDLLGAPALQKDLTYQTLLNQPYVEPDPKSTLINPTEPAYLYTEYAAALNVTHKAPPTNDVRDTGSIDLYKHYYQTISAVQTHNAYILSELYADFKNQNQVKQTQDSLIQKASDSHWFAQVASENIGIVLRQILLYNSQTYVLLVQLLETQKKLLASQVMNNALLIAVNQETERRLYKKANGEPP